MEKRNALFLLLLAWTIVSDAEKPNVLFILSEDQNYETIRAPGYTEIDTPNLDRLTAGGTTFTPASNMGAYSAVGYEAYFTGRW